MRILAHAALLLGLCGFTMAPALAQDTAQEPAAAHGLAMHGAPKYGPGFTHFDYVNPDAPRGGTMRMAGYDTFDNLNNFIMKGVSAEGLGLLYSTLMEQSADEPFTVYGGLAESVETPEDRSQVIFTLREGARWHDGEPVTAADVKWTFETLTTKGLPFYRAYYANVSDVEVLDERRVKFTFDMANNRELPLIVGQLPILPQHYWTAEGRDFEQTTLTPPVGSGPYKIGRIQPGRSIEYVRVADWWGDDVPAYKGRYNFERIVYEYYKDQNVSLEALFAGEYDFRQEYVAKLWATAYNAPPVNDGRIVKEVIENDLPQGMQAFVMNIRRPVFQDMAVRKAMNLAFDFEWSNEQFAYGAYTRTNSYFENSEMQAEGLPEGKELEILEQFRDRLPETVFTTPYENPTTDGSGNNRTNLRRAAQLLDEAGWTLGPDGVRSKDGVRLEFQLLIAGVNEGFQRWFQPWQDSLGKIGIKGSIRTVDATQYVNRIMTFDYDLIVGSWGQSNSPGNEQREFWASDRAAMQGSRNYIGLQDPVIDELVELIIAAPTREDLVARTRALDRVLLSGWYVVPNWHIPAWRIAHWDKYEKPSTQAPFALGAIDTWWAKQ